jgi:hypothetical protein
MPLAAAVFALLLAGSAAAQPQTAPPANAPALPASAPDSALPLKQAALESTQAFLNAADQVLAQMSRILDLPVKEPLKKSLRSRQEIRALLIQEENRDKNEAQRYADEKSLEAFGLVPKDFPLDSFMLDLLTDQVAGMYDPEAREFYIADWIPIDDQREVMSHELTHALEDQSFHIEAWIKAARPNDDAEMARDSVSEGSAIAAMIDYALRDEHVGVRDLPDVTQLIRTGALTDLEKDSVLARAPIYIRDSLMFPYLEGAAFSQQFLKAHTGWADLKLVFENPPVSTQQIIHPQLYLKGVQPVPVALPAWKKIAPKDWKLLEENVMGEFGLQELLKQFLDADRAAALAPAWAGDRYAVFESSRTHETPVVFRLALDTSDHAARFFAEYTEALEKKYPTRTRAYHEPEFLQFQTADGGVFLRCVAAECLDVERATRKTFNSIDRAIGWNKPPKARAAKASVQWPPRRPAFAAVGSSERSAPAGVPGDDGVN